MILRYYLAYFLRRFSTFAFNYRIFNTTRTKYLWKWNILYCVETICAYCNWRFNEFCLIFCKIVLQRNKYQLNFKEYYLFQPLKQGFWCVNIYTLGRVWSFSHSSIETPDKKRKKFTCQTRRPKRKSKLHMLNLPTPYPRSETTKSVVRGWLN